MSAQSAPVLRLAGYEAQDGPVGVDAPDVSRGGRRPARWQQLVLRAGWAKVLRPSELTVLSVLVAHADIDTLVSRPGVLTIAEQAGVSRRSAQMALRRLCEVGLIEKRTMGGGRMAAHYRLVWGATDGPSDSPESGRGAQPIAPLGRNPLRPSSATHCALTDP